MKNKRLTILVLILTGALFAGYRSACAQPQGYPSAIVRLVVPFPPGNPTDTIARLIAQRLTESLGRQVIVDSRPGAGGNIGAEIVARAAPDGHTMLMAMSGIMTINQFLYSKISYDAAKDFAPVTQVMWQPYILVVHPSLPARSMRELIALAKAKPGQMSYGSSGAGSTNHLAAELFKTTAHIDIMHVPYKSGSMPALLGGEIQLMFIQPITAIQQVNTGKLRALAITTAQRFPSLPEIATVAESGLAGFEVTPWGGIAFPAATSQDIVRRMQNEIAKVLQVPDFRAKMLRDGVVLVGNSPEEFTHYIRMERTKWQKVVKDADVRAD